jgi:phosphate-selective porin OprO/OprP
VVSDRIFHRHRGTGKKDRWSWRAAAYSASGEPEFGHFDSGYFGLLSAGRDIGGNGSVRIDYVYNDPDYAGEYEPGTRDLRQVLALVYKQQRGKLGLQSEVAMASGLEDQGDLAGLQLMPFYELTGQFQLVLQYAGVFSTEGRSDVRLGRYPSRVPGADRVEAAHNALLGLNWMLYGHKLKWQNAVEYNYGSNLAATGSDYNGYGFTSALRISW